jgi:hypothetical protein
MIVWSGYDFFHFTATGGRYNPVTDTWIATNITGAPSARHEHTAVWSGTEMIVWGGRTFDVSFDTGGRYDPFTDSWAATNNIDAPPFRFDHTAVWTGGEMIVWGGSFYDGTRYQYRNTGGRYNPVTDSWLATTTTDAPDSRSGHTAVWTGGEMIVWGGFSDDGSSFQFFNTGGRYCAQAGSPTPTPTPTPTATPTPTPGQIRLRANTDRFNRTLVVHLRWTGATTPSVKIFRNGVWIAKVQNTGTYSDTLIEHGIYTYQVCEARTGNCSNEVNVRFGGP